MNLYLEIVESPDTSLLGAKFKIYPGMTLGRKDVDFQIKDRKLSAFHAQITAAEDGRLSLVDQDSSNGILINERRVRQVVLFPNVIFTIGKTKIRVFESVGDSAIEGLRFANWSDELKMRLRLFLDQQSEKISEITAGSPFSAIRSGPYHSEVGPFEEAIKLDFVSGIQTDEELVLGYGPRRGGFHHYDISLLEPQCPDELFELRPTETGVEILCFDPQFIKVNGASVSKKVLRSGDVLSFGRSQIRISLIGGT